MRHRQVRPGAIDCLDLGLLVEGEDDRPLGWTQVESDDDGELRAGIDRHLEALGIRRRQVAVSPDRCHDVFAGTEESGAHPPRSVRRRVVGTRVHRRSDVLGDDPLGQPGPASSALSDRVNSRHAPDREAPASRSNAVGRVSHASRDLVVDAVRGQDQRTCWRTARCGADVERARPLSSRAARARPAPSVPQASWQSCRCSYFTDFGDGSLGAALFFVVIDKRSVAAEEAASCPPCGDRESRWT